VSTEPVSGGRPVTVVDCLGLACPIPVVRLARAISQAEIGQVVELLADDPGAKVDIPVWCRLKDQELLGRDDNPDGGWRFRVRRAR
jgi:tRNA 2-thiouridine synthesizing protein A